MTHKTLIIMRHGKSDWSSAADSDFDRPLSPRGRKDTPAMAKWLRKQPIMPDIFLSSPARRAMDTATLVCETLQRDPADIVTDPELYEAGRQDLLDAISRHAGDADCLMLFGHNPGLDSLVSYLASTAPPLSPADKLMTTAAIAILQHQGDAWQLDQSGWDIVQIKRPKEL